MIESPTDTRSLGSAVFWLIVLGFLLSWIPVVGPAIAGLVGGWLAGGPGRALVAVLVPAAILGAVIITAGTLTSHWLPVAFLGFAGLALGLIQLKIFILAAVVGGLVRRVMK